MIAVTIALATALAGAIALIAWLAYQLVGSKNDQRDAAVKYADQKQDVERAEFELKAERQERERLEHRSAQLEEVIRHACEQSQLGNGLDMADVAGRVLRIEEQWRLQAGDSVSTNPNAPVYREPATEPAKPRDMLGDGLEVP